ncbi:uncharacterized protein C8Q71DRAFT_751914 [Rhodofomes roseus]|uniref:Uncharacterized protein n=1 Tax=Rhodofomes roseus TaxID=34475 RepID=A0ABQ8KKE9_9APHY|nr:uncharacterized protein C8Q71DRAFT_751914 [Rhodofomes roseus]KAH9838576.1 hypothetical protein C8Q71DRAFT_751914 [Rhodofomes roseus]
MPAGYAPLPNPRSEPDADRELEDAFDDHEDDEHSATETSHLTHGHYVDSHPLAVDTTAPSAATPTSRPGAYDFEREYEYDFPPPGSPPSPSNFARPNDWGNSNGELPVAPQRPEPPRPSFFRRVVGALLPQHYSRVPTEPNGASAPLGGGLDNDGVFANVMAKPGRSVALTNENGEVIMVPEDSQNELPPSYQEAQADAVPPYWETTVMAPAMMSIGGDMIVDDLPTGSVIFFISTAFVSYFFQFVGFVLTYLLHTTHAAKHGSRAGLGLTMIQYGFSSRMRAAQEEGDGGVGQDLILWNATTGLPEVIHKTGPGQAMLPNGTVIDISSAEWSMGSRDWMSFLLIIMGWFLLVASIIGFYRVKRWEKSIRQAANPPAPSSSEQVLQDIETRRNIERVFGIYDYNEHAEPPTPTTTQLNEAESRLQRDLREAGLL